LCNRAPSWSGALRPVRILVGCTYSGSGALRPPPPVVAPLVPRCALLPAATPRVRAIRHRSVQKPNRRYPQRWRCDEGLPCAKRRRGGSPREGARSEARAEQRPAAGGAAPPTRSTHSQQNLSAPDPEHVLPTKLISASDHDGGLLHKALLRPASPLQRTSWPDCPHRSTRPPSQLRGTQRAWSTRGL